MTALAFARRNGFTPGANLPGEQADTTWLFVLPSPTAGRVVVAGTAPPGTLVALRALAGEVTERDDLTGADLAYVASGATAAGAADVLARGGAIYLEPPVSDPVAFALTRVDGPVRLDAVADGGDWCLPVAPVARRLPDHLPARMALAVAKPARRAVRAALGRAGRDIPGGGLLGLTPADGPIAGCGVLRRGDGEDPAAPPRYLREVAAAAGVDISRSGWAIAPPRGFRSQKVIFVLDEPSCVAKVTQDPVFNVNLGNERDALQALEALGGHPGVPRVLFAGEHGGLLVVAQTRVPGRPFRSVSDGSAGCPEAARAVEALIALGAVAAPRDDFSADLADALGELLARHEQIHSPSPAQLASLRAHIDTIRRAGLRPAFLHGDPSTLNLLIAEDGQISLVDWENGEPEGPPLWDLLYFANAYGAWEAERAGRHWTARRARRRLLDRGPLHGFLTTTLQRGTAAAGVPAEAVPALIVTFYLWFALREATRLPAGEAATGHYARLLASLAADPPRLRISS